MGYGHSWSIGRTLANEKVLRTELFQVETSLAVTAGLAVLAAALLLAVTSRILRSAAGGARLGSDLLFVLFLLGQFASLYAVLSMSWGVALRYWYPLVPCFAALLAFGARFLLLAAGGASKALGRAAAVGLIGFVLFFVSVNYHDFLYQTIGQHSQRRVDERLIATITRFLDEGETVDVLAKTGADGHPEALPRFLTVVFSSFMPRFHDRSYSIRRLPSIDYDAVLGGRAAWRLRRREPPFDRPSPPWVVALREESALSGEEKAVFSARENYRLLSWTRALAGLLQGTPWPYLHHDGGIYPLYSDLYDNPYRWTIYRGARMVDLSDAFKSRLVEQLAEAEPAIDSEYRIYHRVYHSKSYLVYVIPPRTEMETAESEQAADGPCDGSRHMEQFFLQWYPAEPGDLVPGREEQGLNFNYHTFRFDDHDFEYDGRCLAMIPFPVYDVERIGTGERTRERHEFSPGRG